MNDRDRAILWAQQRMAEDFVVLDTETTGLGDDDEAVSIGVVDKYGNILLDTLLCHQKPSNPIAMKVHRHTLDSTNAHNAAGDALATVEVVKAMSLANYEYEEIPF